MHHRLNLLAHVIVLIAHLNLSRALAILAVDLAYEVFEFALAALKTCPVVVADDIGQRRLFHRAVHADQVVESLIALRVLGCLPARQHDCQLVGYAHRVLHLMVRAARVHVHAVHVDLAVRGVEVLKLQLAYCSAVHRVGEVATEG